MFNDLSVIVFRCFFGDLFLIDNTATEYHIYYYKQFTSILNFVVISKLTKKQIKLIYSYLNKKCINYVLRQQTTTDHL